MDIFDPTSFSGRTNETSASDVFYKDRDEADGIERSSGGVNSDPIREEEPSDLKMEFDRFRGPFHVRDFVTLSSKDLLRLAEGLDRAKAEAEGNFSWNGPSGDKFMRGNNAVLKDWPKDAILTNSRYRLTDAFGRKWSGPLRTLGVLSHVKHPRLVGYVVKRSPTVSLPDLKKHLTYPLGSATVRLNKTHQDLRNLHEMMPVYASYDIYLDVSVSSMVEEEGKFLRNTISPHQFSYDVLEAHRLANELRGDFLASAIEGHNDIYLWGTVEYCIKHALYGIDDLGLAEELLCSLVGSYNHASMGVKYQFLSSKAMPDPIQVGNLGDLNGNMAADDTEFDLSSYIGQLAGGATAFLKTLYSSPSLGQIGIAKNDGDGSSGPGWMKEPAPDGGKTWNFGHLQAAYHLDGQTIIPPNVGWFDEARLVVVNDVISNKLRQCGKAGLGDLRLVRNFEDYVFIPAIRYNPGYSHVIHQDGSVINLLVDRYDPEVDNDS